VLDRGAVAAGFDNDRWTLARIAGVIERVGGVVHHPGHVWRIPEPVNLDETGQPGNC
jgi:transposase